MKKIILTLMLSVTLAIPVIETGCGTTSPKSPVAITFLNMRTVQNGVSKALEVYGIKRAQGKVSDEQKNKIKEVYSSYQSSFNAAIELAKFNYSAAAPEELTQLANTLEALITNL